MEYSGHKKQHHRQAGGGKVEPAIHPKTYAGAGSNVEKEAEEKKAGGKVGRKAGGKVGRKAGGHVLGKHAHMRLDRPGRKLGGSVGADKHPLTSAAKITDAEDHKAEEGNAGEGP